jgi:hypothetical protein
MKGIRAKLFQNGGSQAVRLPKAYRFARSARWWFGARGGA